MPTSNEQLLDESIRRALWVSRYRQSLSNETIAAFNDNLYPELVKAIEEKLKRVDQSRTPSQKRRALLQLVDDLRSISSSGFVSVEKNTTEKLLTATTLEGSWSVDVLTKASVGAFQVTLPSSGTFSTIVNQDPYLGLTFREWIRDIDESTIKTIQKQLQIGLTLGENVPEMVRRVEGTKEMRYRDGVLSRTRRNIETVVQTGVTHVTNQARQKVYEQNRKLIKGIMWVSTLDTKTSNICISLDGEIFAVDEGPRPPAHLRCRSTTTPITKSFRELGVPIDELSESTRASMNGQVPESLTYGGWLRMQSSEVQIEVLGVGRAKLFRQGKLEVKDLVDNRFNTLTLEELRKKSGS